MASSGWDAISDDGQPPIDFAGTDAELWKHLPTLVDGVTKRAVNDNTQLVALYQYQSPRSEVDNQLLKNLTGVSRPQVPCQLVLSNDERLPPKVGMDECPYELTLSFNKLLLAPVVRLTCSFLRISMPETRHIPHDVVIEWHFNDYDGPGTGITDYTHDMSTSLITFTAGPATCTGVSKLELDAHRLRDEAATIFTVLKTFLEPGRKSRTIRLKGFELTAEAKDELAKVSSRLPSGSGTLLPSIGPKIPEYATFGNQSTIHCSKEGMRKISAMLRADNKHPMVPLDCINTFSTVKEAAVQLAYSAVAAEAESREAMKLWAKVYHKATIFTVESFAVLGVRFGEFEKLGSVNDDLLYRLPKEMSVKVLFRDPRSGQSVQVKAVLMETVAELPAHDAFFRIISVSKKYFGNGGEGSSGRRQDYFDVKFVPTYISATYTAQLSTVGQLQNPSNQRWHKVLLNQVHDALDIVDLTKPKEPGAAISPHVRRVAEEWLAKWMQWNQEQLAVIRGIKAAKGGCIVVMGPAGTGKTLLQQALSIYFYLLGFHVLALAPANSNVDHLAVQLGKIKSREGLPIPLKFMRMFPSVRDFITPEDDNITNPEFKKHNLEHFYDLLSALDERENDKTGARQYGLVQAVLHAAEHNTHSLNRRLRSEAGRALGEPVNGWDILREFIAKWKTGGMSREELRAGCDAGVMDTYRMAYSQCRAHLIGRNRFMLATTGNCKASELRQNWYAETAEWGLKRVGVIVFVDEAAKDVEVNVWNGVMCEQWSHGVSGIIMLGDDKQLKPTNTCSTGKVNFNAFNHRLDIPLPCRLVEEGFPHYPLREQRRMHESISRFPNREFYNNKLRDGPGTDLPLDLKFPRLSATLKSIVAQCMPNNQERGTYTRNATDADIRLHWIEVTGERIRHPATKSITVKEHVQVFFKKILPRLVQCFRLMGKRLEDHLMIICAYSYALHEYQDEIRMLLRRNKAYTQSDMPRILTVDASQGQEATMVIFDGSCQHRDVLGFVNDDGRCNVAITRAKEVFWMVGGKMEIKDRRNIAAKSATLVKYKNELELMGKCHRFA
ncbi:hypothetical protein LTR56_003453 [Elasticomyces elasticus]|nr:hypothetical protein LTR22_010929 [Elasticomyces elasticus]KAK3655447.1 hypothetical protein LTR56_003453 [Elasticomyces elasticus]KAK4919916.1 hypothetical protein LTR49_012514 [Elasticomyces elasticus]KAK5756702.1 hypothetical protein LTS12_013165 [Elasticomyces elasticus]